MGILESVPKAPARRKKKGLGKVSAFSSTSIKRVLYLYWGFPKLLATSSLLHAKGKACTAVA